MSVFPSRASAVRLGLLCAGLSLALSAAAQSGADADPTTLDAIDVKGERPRGYTVEQTAVATRLALTPQQTPQSVSVITAQRIEDQHLTSLREVLDNVTGVSSNAYDTERVLFYARGFPVENMAYDGVPVAPGLNSGSADASLDPAIYERIEVLRGASGLLSGAGSPSATINFVRKRADSRTLQGEASLSVGSWDTVRGTADVAAPLSADGSVRGRAVAAYEHGDSYLDRYRKDTRVLYAVVDADLGTDTTLSVGYDYQQNRPRGVTWGSYPVFYDDGGFIAWPRGFSTAADWTFWNTTTATAFADLQHRFGNGWQLHALASRRRSDGDMALFYVYGFPNRATGETLAPSAYRSRDRARQNMLDVYASGPFRAWGREHELVLGLSGSRYTRTSWLHATEALAPVGDLLHWDGRYPYPQFAADAQQVTAIRTDQQGAYAAARLSLAEPLTLIAGARYSRWKNATDDVYSGVFRHDHRKTVPYAGLVYAITPVYSAFVSYTQIFDPQDKRRRDGSFLDPVLGSSREIGLKGRHFDGRLNTSLVLFDTHQDNVAEADVGQFLPDGLTQAYVPVSGTRSRGWEFEAAGDLREGWNASLGWSHFDLQGPDGTALRTALPRTLLRLFTTYRLPGAWDRLSVGGGANWQSASRAAVDGPDGPQRVNQSAVTLIEAMARYRIGPHAALQFNARNLLDRKYFVLDEYSNLYYAAGRSATVSFTYAF